MKQVFTFLGPIVLILVISYGLYYIGKTLSYNIFYADMVEKTIKEKVLEKCLK